MVLWSETDIKTRKAQAWAAFWKIESTIPLQNPSNKNQNRNIQRSVPVYIVKRL
jgi:hypothetical protein